MALVAAGCLSPVAVSPRHATAPSTPTVTGAVMPAPERARVQFAHLPLAFEPNVGQASGEVRYLSHGPGMRVELTPDGARLTPSTATGQRRAVRLRMLGAAPAPVLTAEDELPGKAHHVTGSDPAAWHRDVPTYRRVVYRGLYPGTDLVFHGSHGAAEFDFVVGPGGDPRAIRLEIDGASALTLDGDDVIIAAAGEALRLHAPVVYQESAQGRVRVDGRFRLQGRRIAFDVGEYDRARPLVIDPVVTYATYINGGGGGIGVDASGSIYVTTGVAILKLSADGSTLLWSTTFGDMRVGALVVDAAGNAYMLGTCPYNRSGIIYVCPTLNPTGTVLASGHAQAQGDIGGYVLKVSPGGSLLFSTSMGGVGSVTPGGIAVDAAGNIYATAWNVYDGFPLTRPAYSTPGGAGGFHTVVEAIAADYSRFLYVVEIQTGGDILEPRGLAVDRAGAAYLTGATGTQFPTTPGAFQPTTASRAGVVAKIAADGGLAYATYFGNASTSPRAIAVDADGSAYITGVAGPGLPTVRAMQPALAGGTDAFVARLDATGSALVFATYLGGNGDDAATTMGLDSSANIYVAGTTRSTDFPQRNPLSAQFGSAASNFVAELNSDGSTLVYSTYFADAQTSIAALSVTATGIVYLTGGTSSTSLPTVRPYQASPGSGFVAKLEPSDVRVFITTPAEGATVSGTVWSDVWVENYVGTSNTFTLSIGDTVLATGGANNHATLAWDSSRVPDGPQTLTATVRDSAGHVGTTTRALTVRNGTTPTLVAALTSPAANATVSGTVTVGMSETGASGTPITFTLAVDGTQVFTATGTATTASFAWSTTTVPDGAHTLGLTVRDGAGRTATATRGVTVANGGAGTLKVFITSPADGATVSGTVWSDVWVEGAVAGSRTFTLAIGGVTLATGADPSNHVTLPWDSTRVGNGTQTLVATVRDASGSSGTTTRAFNVQNAGGPAPLVASVTAPADGATVSGTVTVGMSETGASGTPIAFTLTVDGTQVFATSGAAATASFGWNTTGVVDGAHTLGLTVQDGAGRKAAATRSVTVRNTTPSPPPGPISVFITQPRSGDTVRGVVWFTIWVEGAASGAKTYTLSEGGQTLSTTTTTSSGPVSIPWSTTTANNGARTPTVGVRDSTGATGSASINVTVAN